ncbi:MAG TPA: ABC transporter ATP-binding protein, partial [Microvirga sp.]|nr:ABC transporter ATP-binding protein [Microvirga sp.]
MSMTKQTKRGDATRDVLRFTFQHWRDEPRYVALVVVTIMISTLADVFMPVFAGRLVDALAASGGNREDALNAALAAFAIMTGLGLVTIVMRHLSFYGIVELTLRIMGRVARDAFARVQR